jgi:hypothetical protein
MGESFIDDLKSPSAQRSIPSLPETREPMQNIGRSYLDRYKQGAYEQVWRELMQLGPDVREEPVFNDAEAVAQETMRRVRQNIEILIVRLLRLGYVFGYDHRFRDALLSPKTYLAYLEMVFWRQQQSPVFLDAQLRGQRVQDIYGGDYQAIPDIPAMLEAMEQEFGPAPLSIHAWYTEIGAVNFYGYFSPWDALMHRQYPDLSLYEDPFGTFFMSYCDPFQVRAPNEEILSALREQRKKQGDSWPFVDFEFADDVSFKDYTGGSYSNYTITLPDAGADAKTWGMTFVEYVRLSLLQYAGFPGMAEWAEKPEEDLAMLTKDLIPF